MCERECVSDSDMTHALSHTQVRALVSPPPSRGSICKHKRMNSTHTRIPETYAHTHTHTHTHTICRFLFLLHLVLLNLVILSIYGLCVCVYLCVFVCVRICIYVCVHIYICVWERVYVRAGESTRPKTRTRAGMCASHRMGGIASCLCC